MQARIAKSFDELVKSKVNNHQALNDIEIKHLCQVAFKDKMSKVNGYENFIPYPEAREFVY